MNPTSSSIAPVLFDERDFAGVRDIRRWRAGERNTRRGSSPLHGFGSFAVRTIHRGEILLIREPLSGNFPVNHSEQPNAGRAVNRAGLFALREIAKGEEITEDYRFLPFFRQAIPDVGRQIIAATPGEYRAFMSGNGFLLQPAVALSPERQVSF